MVPLLLRSPLHHKHVAINQLETALRYILADPSLWRARTRPHIRHVPHLEVCSGAEGQGGDDGLLPEMTPAMAASAPRAPSVPRLAALATGGLLYAQVGAFGVEANALALRDRLQEGSVKNVLVVRVTRDGKALWRVRIGPIASVDDYDAVVDQLERLGIREISLARLAPARDAAQAGE